MNRLFGKKQASEKQATCNIKPNITSAKSGLRGRRLSIDSSSENTITSDPSGERRSSAKSSYWQRFITFFSSKKSPNKGEESDKGQAFTVFSPSDTEKSSTLPRAKKIDFSPEYSRSSKLLKFLRKARKPKPTAAYLEQLEGRIFKFALAIARLELLIEQKNQDCTYLANIDGLDFYQFASTCRPENLKNLKDEIALHQAEIKQIQAACESLYLTYLDVKKQCSAPNKKVDLSFAKAKKPEATKENIEALSLRFLHFESKIRHFSRSIDSKKDQLDKMKKAMLKASFAPTVHRAYCLKMNELSYEIRFEQAQLEQIKHAHTGNILLNIKLKHQADSNKVLSFAQNLLLFSGIKQPVTTNEPELESQAIYSNIEKSKPQADPVPEKTTKEDLEALNGQIYRFETELARLTKLVEQKTHQARLHDESALNAKTNLDYQEHINQAELLNYQIKLHQDELASIEVSHSSLLMMYEKMKLEIASLGSISMLVSVPVSMSEQPERNPFFSSAEDLSHLGASSIVHSSITDADTLDAKTKAASSKNESEKSLKEQIKALQDISQKAEDKLIFLQERQEELVKNTDLAKAKVRHFKRMQISKYEIDLAKIECREEKAREAEGERQIVTAKRHCKSIQQRVRQLRLQYYEPTDQHLRLEGRTTAPHFEAFAAPQLKEPVAHPCFNARNPAPQIFKPKVPEPKNSGAKPKLAPLVISAKEQHRLKQRREKREADLIRANMHITNARNQLNKLEEERKSKQKALAFFTEKVICFKDTNMPLDDIERVRKRREEARQQLKDLKKEIRKTQNFFDLWQKEFERLKKKPTLDS